MVSHPRAPLRFDRLRSLNQPQPVKVACDSKGRPAFVWQGRRRKVTAVRDHWRIDDEWWREPIHRLYYLVELEEGCLEVLFCDLVTGAWYRQREIVPLYGEEDGPIPNGGESDPREDPGGRQM